MLLPKARRHIHNHTILSGSEERTNKIFYGVKVVSKNHSQIHFCVTSMISGPVSLADQSYIYALLSF